MYMDIEKVLSEEGMYVSCVVGHSMEPMLHERRDTVAVVPVTERLKKYDVALYRVGEKYVLHRVVKVLPDSYVFCGDNCVELEHGITDKDILGKLAEVYRGEEKMNLDGFGYRFYCRARVMGFLPRKIMRRLRGAVLRRLKKTSRNKNSTEA